ncbi:hypothetical protein [Nonomuraea sp. B1E8]|uniref:hypothetical protein n=1 Tax=unclassified Nonomuraea TaxID=2593643 RepID=UPI00325D6E59
MEWSSLDPAPLVRSFLTGAVDAGVRRRRGTEDRVTSTVPDVTGRPARSFAEFVTEHRAAFAATGHADEGATTRR